MLLYNMNRNVYEMYTNNNSVKFYNMMQYFGYKFDVQLSCRVQCAISLR